MGNLRTQSQLTDNSVNTSPLDGMSCQLSPRRDRLSLPVRSECIIGYCGYSLSLCNGGVMRIPHLGYSLYHEGIKS